jgi:hypothetical protein
MPTLTLSRQQVIEAALCCRIGAMQDRKDAAAQTSVAVKATLEQSAR